MDIEIESSSNRLSYDYYNTHRDAHQSSVINAIYLK